MPGARGKVGMASLNELGIPTARRVAGAVVMIGIYFAAVMGLIQPDYYAFGQTVSNNDAPVVSLIVAIMMPLGAAYLTPYIFYPCLFDRFPDWIVRRTPLKKLQKIASGVFGVQVTVNRSGVP